MGPSPISGVMSQSEVLLFPSIRGARGSWHQSISLKEDAGHIVATGRMPLVRTSADCYQGEVLCVRQVQLGHIRGDPSKQLELWKGTLQDTSQSTLAAQSKGTKFRS